MGESTADNERNAGASTDQHVTGSAETGRSPVDAEPSADTPAHGSGNAGVDTSRPGPAGEREDRG